MKLFYKLVIIIFIYNLSSISARSAEVPPSLVTDLSKKVISINVSFSGSKFHIFGAIKKYASQISPIDQPPFDIIIEVIGPPVEMNIFKNTLKFIQSHPEEIAKIFDVSKNKNNGFELLLLFDDKNKNIYEKYLK